MAAIIPFEDVIPSKSSENVKYFDIRRVADIKIDNYYKSLIINLFKET